RDRRGVLGPGGPVEEAYASYARAVAAWPLHAAGRLGGDKLAYARDHMLALLLSADRELTRDLVRIRLAPLEGQTPAAYDRAITTLEAWLDAHGDVTAAATALHVHPQTVRYRLAGLRERFGEALEDPLALLELQLALRARELVD
ncbi:MAG: regulatory protein LysR, partial [Solirubrobacterales bacterium]|nr:regulatory protein LysR [Solirubrobacterales bacterium]